MSIACRPVQMYSKSVDAILEAGIQSGDDGSMVINPAEGVTMEQQEKFWSYLDEAGVMFAQEIIDVCQHKICKLY
jgi:hypothetical protein